MIRLVALLLWLPCVTMAQNYPVPLSDTVNDYARLLPADVAARISVNLQAARDETDVHIVLITIDAQATYGGTGRFADFATGWFNDWGIGDAVRNDGILILVAAEDREMRIVLGNAYDVIWDGRAQRVIDTAMLPAFRDGDYPKGLEDGAQSAIDRLARPFAAGADLTADSGFEAAPDPSGLVGVLVTVGTFLGVFAVIFKARLRDVLVRFRACPNCGARQLRVTGRVTLHATEAVRGRRERVEHCKSCGNDRVESYDIPSKAEARASKAKGSSGFGGGRSGGGGASGKW
jgi:uncharacterized protein